MALPYVQSSPSSDQGESWWEHDARQLLESFFSLFLFYFLPLFPIDQLCGWVRVRFYFDHEDDDDEWKQQSSNSKVLKTSFYVSI